KPTARNTPPMITTSTTITRARTGEEVSSSGSGPAGFGGRGSRGGRAGRGPAALAARGGRAPGAAVLARGAPVGGRRGGGAVVAAGRAASGAGVGEQASRGHAPVYSERARHGRLGTGRSGLQTCGHGACIRPSAGGPPGPDGAAGWPGCLRQRR